MRYVPTAQAPASLQDYLINLGATYPATNGAQAKALWEEFRTHDVYKQCLGALRAAQFGTCGYCEQRAITSPNRVRVEQIEHVEPKSVFHARTLDFCNFLFCCTGGTQQTKDPGHRHAPGGDSCGQRKGDAVIPAAMDPRGWPIDFRLTNTTVDGRLQVRDEACATLGISTADAEYVINITLNLNCLRLVRARAVKIAEIQSKMRRQYRALQADPNNAAMRRALKIEINALRVESKRVNPDGYMPSFISVIDEYLSA